MKLRIENSEAKEALFVSNFTPPVEYGEWVQIPLSLELQKRSNWCWASIGSSLFSYYNEENSGQEEIVCRLFQIKGKPESTRVQEDARYNTEQHLDKVLKIANCYSHWSLGKPSLDRIKISINNGHPVCVRIQWYNGGSHYVLIKGYNKNKASIKIDDPAEGECISLYDDFPKTYRHGGAVWIETFWTQKYFI